MLRQVKRLSGDVLRANNGDIGSVDEILFDDEQWTVRYIVADTGGGLHRRKVLLATRSLGALDWESRILNVELTREEVENSPGAETDRPLSRQWEANFHDYYGWPYYWGGIGMSGSMLYPGPMFIGAAPMAIGPDPERNEPAPDVLAAQDEGDVHLRSTKEVTGYKIIALDGQLGHVDDFIFDDETWRISYIAVDTRDWWRGKRVLVPPDWILQASWPAGTVTVELSRDQLRNCPEWDQAAAISSEFQHELAHYYARLRQERSNGPAVQTEADGEAAVRGR